MKILLKQFLGKNHSWAIFGWGIAKSLKDLGHDVHLFSTDGIKYLPDSLKENIIGYTQENQNELFGSLPDKKYDCQISYTSMKNFSNYLSFADKNRFGVWCYEWAGDNVLPTGFAKHYKSCNYVCVPSVFSKRVFMESKIPESAIKVIPHGIDSNQYSKNTKIELPTNKRFKILANVAQNHLRKNIPGLLEVYGKAFSNKDDVCLILKSKDKPVQSQFEISIKDCLNNFYKKFPQHAEIKLYSEFVDDISDLYRSVDAVFSMTYCEGFFFPGLEALAAGKMVIAPNWGGQVDFLNASNALLINGKETRANPKSMYWESKPNAIWFEPNVDDAVEKLKFSYLNYEEFNKKVDSQRLSVYQTYDWKEISKKFLEMCE